MVPLKPHLLRHLSKTIRISYHIICRNWTHLELEPLLASAVHLKKKRTGPWFNPLEYFAVICGFLFCFFKLFIFNWRVIALQYCVDFCYSLTWISHRYIHVPPNLSPTSHPSHPSRLSPSTVIHQAVTHWLSILHTVIYMFQNYSLSSSTLSFPHCVHKPILCLSPLLKSLSNLNHPGSPCIWDDPTKVK